MYKKHSSFSFTALLFVPHLSEHERPGAIGILKAVVRVSCIARYHNGLPSAIQHLRDCYQATRAVKGRHRPGQLRMTTDIKTATNVDYIDDIYIDDIRSHWLPTLPDEQQGSKGNLFQIFNKTHFITITLNYAQFHDKFQIAALESKGIVF